MEHNELKPCPFCGGKAVIRETKIYLTEAIQIHCEKCSVHTPKAPFNHLRYYDGEEIQMTREMAAQEVIEKWNRRASVDQIAKELLEGEKCLDE